MCRNTGNNNRSIAGRRINTNGLAILRNIIATANSTRRRRRHRRSSITRNGEVEVVVVALVA